MQHKRFFLKKKNIGRSDRDVCVPAIAPGSDAHREASEARIPRSDKGSRSCAEAVENASAATMLTNAWTRERGHATHA